MRQSDCRVSLKPSTVVVSGYSFNKTLSFFSIFHQNDAVRQLGEITRYKKWKCQAGGVEGGIC